MEKQKPFSNHSMLRPFYVKVPWNLLDSPEMFQRLLNSISRKAYGRCIYCTYTYISLFHGLTFKFFIFHLRPRAEFLRLFFSTSFSAGETDIFLFFQKKKSKKAKISPEIPDLFEVAVPFFNFQTFLWVEKVRKQGAAAIFF